MNGYLIFAHNNEEIDYLTIALCNALLIRHNSSVKNVSVVTDEGSLSWVKSQRGSLLDVFDKIIVVDQPKGSSRNFRDTLSTTKKLPWRNKNRSSAYNLTPYKETILLDGDYLILDSSLDAVWGSVEPVLINDKAITLESKDPAQEELRIHPMSIPMRWATCVYFQKTEEAKILFDMVDFVSENYAYYQTLYGFPSDKFRNDYAFSIAIHVMNGFVDSGIKALPNNKLLTSFDCDELCSIPKKNHFNFLVNDTERRYDFSVRAISNNVHVMNKFSITRHADRIMELYS